MGVFTPHSVSSLRPLILNQGSLEHALLILTTLHYQVTELPQQFVSQLPHPTDEFALEQEKSPVPELLSRFMAFLTRHVTGGEERMAHKESTRSFYVLF